HSTAFYASVHLPQTIGLPDRASKPREGHEMSGMMTDRFVVSRVMRAHAALIAMLVGLAALAGARPALAHQDPPGCCGTGVDFRFLAFRSDGSDLDDLMPSECETITYQIIVGKSNIGTPCAFE